MSETNITKKILTGTVVAAAASALGVEGVNYSNSHESPQHKAKVAQAQQELAAHLQRHPNDPRMARIILKDSGLVWDAAEKVHEQTGQITGDAAYNISSYLPEGRNSFTHTGEVITVREDSEGHVVPNPNE